MIARRRTTSPQRPARPTYSSAGWPRLLRRCSSVTTRTVPRLSFRKIGLYPTYLERTLDAEITSPRCRTTAVGQSTCTIVSVAEGRSEPLTLPTPPLHLPVQNADVRALSTRWDLQSELHGDHTRLERGLVQVGPRSRDETMTHRSCSDSLFAKIEQIHGQDSRIWQIFREPVADTQHPAA